MPVLSYVILKDAFGAATNVAYSLKQNLQFQSHNSCVCSKALQFELLKRFCHTHDWINDLSRKGHIK